MAGSPNTDNNTRSALQNNAGWDPNLDPAWAGARVDQVSFSILPGFAAAEYLGKRQARFWADSISSSGGSKGEGGRSCNEVNPWTALRKIRKRWPPARNAFPCS